MSLPSACCVCGGHGFTHNTILWPALIEEWGLSPDEVAYVDRQQGTCCNGCGSNLRSIALAQAVRAWGRTDLILNQWVTSPEAAALRVLEVNEAGMLSASLRGLPGRVLAAYPAVDMQAMPYADGQFDLVVHSDTLEHVPDPLQALRECRRVLRPGGGLCFTVPTIVGRMTRSRAGLPPSYHGLADRRASDWAVQTEFGADAWTVVVRAGFSLVTVLTVDYPTATAMIAIR